jgi:hypothetical protein
MKPYTFICLWCIVSGLRPFIFTHEAHVLSTARVFRRDSLGKAAQWLARSIRESWGVLWLVICLLSERADVSNSVIKAWERLYCIPLHTCQHAGALPTTSSTSPTPRRRTVTSKYSSYAFVSGHARVFFNLDLRLSWYSDWLRSRWPRGSSPHTGKIVLLYTSSKPVMAPTNVSSDSLPQRTSRPREDGE